MNGRLALRLPVTATTTAVTVLLAVLLAGSGCATDATGASDAPTWTSGTTGPAGPRDPFTCPASARDAGAARPGPAAGEQLHVVTTVAPITSIVANIAGDRARVTGLIPEGEDSHTYEPKPSSAKVLAEADVLFVNGLQLEDPTKELAQEHLAPASQLIELGSLTITPAQYRFDNSFPADAGRPNPHLWTNPPMAACYALAAASTMGRADPANAAYFRDNAAAYTARLDELDRLMREATATLPESRRELLTYHDAYAYFAEHYGWRVLGAVQVSNFEEPTPKEVAALIEQVRSRQVPAIFGSEVFPSPVLAQIAAETGARYVDDLRDDDLPGAPGEARHSFLGLLQFDFVTIVASLGGDASGLQGFDPADVAPDRAEYPQ